MLLVQGADDDELRFDLRTLPHPHGHLFAHSLEQAQQFWARVAGCAAGVIAGDSTASQVSAHAVGCPAGVAVELISIARHPHAWPGGLAMWPLAPRLAHGAGWRPNPRRRTFSPTRLYAT